MVRLFACGCRRAFIPSLVRSDYATVNATVARITKPNWSSSRSAAKTQAHFNFSAQPGWFGRPKSQPYCTCKSHMLYIANDSAARLKHDIGEFLAGSLPKDAVE